MSYNQKPPGAGGSGMGSGIPPNGPNNSQQVAKTLAGIQQQMQNLVHGQNALPQSSQADLNVFLQQQRFQNMIKQQQLLHFQMQHQQQQQQQQQHQQKDRGGGGSGSVGNIVGVGGGSGGEPLALTRTPAAAELLNKTFQQHQQQQPNGSAAAPNAALNQFQQQLQALPPNIIQQLQTLQYQMQQHQQQQQQQQQQHPPSQVPPSQHHPTHQQPPPPPPQQQQQQPQSLLTAHQQQQLHGQLQQHQHKALQQFQQSLRYFPTAAPTQTAAAPPPQSPQSGVNKSGSTAPTTQHLPPPQATTAMSNQLKAAPNLPPSTQITPLPGNVGAPIGMTPPSLVAQHQNVTKNTTISPASVPAPTTLANLVSVSGGSTTSAIGTAKQQVPTPCISLLPAKPGTSTSTTSTAALTAAHQQNKFGAGKISPVVSAIPPPFPTQYQKPLAAATGGNSTTPSNITPTSKVGAVPPTGTIPPVQTPSVAITAVATTNKLTQQNANAAPLTKQQQASSTPSSATQSAPAVTTPSSSSPVATAANNGSAASLSDQTKTTQKITHSTAPTTTAKPTIPDAGTAGANKDSKIVSDAPKKAETTSSPSTKAKEDERDIVTAIKPKTEDVKVEQIPLGRSAKEATNATASSEKEIRTDKRNSVEKTNTGGGIKTAEGSDANPEQSKVFPTTKEQENKTINLSKIETAPKVEEKKETGKNLFSTKSVPEEDVKQPKSKEDSQITKTKKDPEKKRTATPTSLAKKEEGRSSDSKANFKAIESQKGQNIEKDEIAKIKSVETIAKTFKTGNAANKPTNAEKKDASNIANDIQHTPLASSNEAEMKSTEITAPPFATKVDGDKQRKGTVVTDDKQKEEKNKITKIEKPEKAATATVAATTCSSSSIGEKSTIQSNNNYSATKSIKSKITETAPDSTNSSTSDASSSTSTSVKRSSRPPKTVTKPTEKITIEKSEKVSSSSRSKKPKSAIIRSDSSYINNNNSSSTADVSTASPATPKPVQGQGPSTSFSDRKSSRHRLKTIPFQSPLPELAYITKLSASEASNSPKPMPTEDKLIVFYKNEYMAVRNAEGTFYLCQTMQNVYRTSPRISIRWLSEDPNNSGVYIPDFYDHTDIECVLTTVELKRVDKGHLSLPNKEQARIENILKKAIDVEKGLLPRPELTEENPDGLDISLFKDESQIEKKFATGVTPTSSRKSRRAGSSIGGTPTTTKSSTSASSASKGRKRGSGSIVSSSGVSSANNGVKSLSKKRKSTSKRKSKSKKSTITDDEIESSDDSDAEYKPNQKNRGTASKASPRAQRSPLARARAASPITSTTAQTKSLSPVKLASTASSRGERANKRKAAAEATAPITENAPPPVKKAGAATSTTTSVTSTATTNASKSTNSKTQESGIESHQKAAGTSTTAEATNVVSSSTNASNNITANSSGGNLEGAGVGATNNRPSRSRK